MSLIDRFGKNLAKMVHDTAPLNYGRKTIQDWTVDYVVRTDCRELSLMDIGCGKGYDLDNMRQAVLAKRPQTEVHMHGIEFYPEAIRQSEALGIKIITGDLEKMTWPLPDASLDIVVANQILEHTKEVFWITSEVARVLKPGGLFIVGVPNVASLHNRFLLLGGEQPTTLETLSAHVRGFTKPTFRRFIQADGYFRLRDFDGGNFYPFPKPIAEKLSHLLPSMAVTIFFCSERTEKPGKFIDILKTRRYETNFYTGPTA